MNTTLAIHGGRPVRDVLLPYGRQCIDESDVQAVVEVLRSDWLTTGPKVAEFEHAFADYVGAREAVAVSSGTAALHAAMYALGIGPGDEVIVPTMTFAATANCIVYQGGIPVFADVEADTLLMDPADVESKITPRSKAIIAVDYAGQPCDYDALKAIANHHNLALVADACHSLGAAFNGSSVGTLADLTAFSFHPVKHVTTGEGGMVTTFDKDLSRRMRNFRNHGITTDFHQRISHGSWFYEMIDIGHNYRLTDFQSALGLNQLSSLPAWIDSRREIARRYDQAFRVLPEISCPRLSRHATHAYHLYVMLIDTEGLGTDRGVIYQALRAEGIGVNVHYIPVHLHPYYQRRFGTGPGMCPVAESAYERLISLPIFPGMTADDVEDVIRAVHRVIEHFRSFRHQLPSRGGP